MQRERTVVVVARVHEHLEREDPLRVALVNLGEHQLQPLVCRARAVAHELARAPASGWCVHTSNAVEREAKHVLVRVAAFLQVV